MKKILVAALVLFATLKVSAVEVGVIGGLGSGGVTTDSTTTSYSNGSGYEIGGLFLFSVFPFVQARTGVISKTRKINASVAGVSYTTQDTILDFPINLEVNFPMGLYVFGGVIYSSTQSSTCAASGGATCTSSSKTPDDMPVNVGLGFNVLDLALFKLGIEGEYQSGTKNIDTSGASTTKVHSLGVNVVAKVGF